MDTMKPRVFVANYAGHDYKDAESYGELQYITKGYLSFHSLDRVKYSVVEEVAKSRSQDWLLLSGKLIISCIAVLAWFSLHKQVKILYWDQKAKRGPKYQELIITADNLEQMLKVITDG